MAKIVFATVTLDGNPQQLTAELNLGHTPVLELHIESDTGNAIVKVGDADIATDVYGASVTAGPANAKTFAQGPSGAAAFNLEDVWVLGTDTQKIRLAFIRH